MLIVVDLILLKIQLKTNILPLSFIVSTEFGIVLIEQANQITFTDSVVLHRFIWIGVCLTIALIPVRDDRQNQIRPHEDYPITNLITFF